MSVRSMKTAFTVAVVALVVAAGSSVTGFDLSAQSGAEIVVGTYDPQAVAQAVGLQQQMMQDMQGLQQRMQQAQQEGDQQAMQEIQAEAQQIQQDAADQFLADVEGVMEEVAQQAGAVIIATDVTYTAEGVSTEDVTQDVIAALGGEAPAAPELEPPGSSGDPGR